MVECESEIIRSAYCIFIVVAALAYYIITPPDALGAIPSRGASH